MDRPKRRRGCSPDVRGDPCAVLLLLERRTVTRADPSLRNSMSAQVSAAASERRSSASRMTDTSAIIHLAAEVGRAGSRSIPRAADGQSHGSRPAPPP